jgi:hypothetical protein
VKAQNNGLHSLTPGWIPHDKFVLDINLISMVNSHRGWAGTFNAQTATFHNHALSQGECVKNDKHELRYAAIVFAFALLVGSRFGGLGPSAIRLMMALACLELSQQPEYARPGLGPLTDVSARSQFLALCFSQSSTRIGHALVKALVKHLLVTPSLPIAPRPLAENSLALLMMCLPLSRILFLSPVLHLPCHLSLALLTPPLLHKFLTSFQMSELANARIFEINYCYHYY